jgi:hypothetical protein
MYEKIPLLSLAVSVLVRFMRKGEPFGQDGANQTGGER